MHFLMRNVNFEFPLSGLHNCAKQKLPLHTVFTTIYDDVGYLSAKNLRVATHVAGDILHEVPDAARRGVQVPYAPLFRAHP